MLVQVLPDYQHRTALRLIEQSEALVRPDTEGSTGPEGHRLTHQTDERAWYLHSIYTVEISRARPGGRDSGGR